MSNSVFAVLLAAGLATAPFQCASEPETNLAIEKTPGQALYELAQTFLARGQNKAYRDTLKYLIEQYPSSRFAQTARADLADGR